MRNRYIINIFFNSAAKAGNHAAKGWAESAYGCSKIGVTVMSFAQQREFNKDTREDIILNPVSEHTVFTITKTRLFKYTEKIPTKKLKVFR